MRPSDRAWLGLVAYIIACEFSLPKHDLLSHAADRYLAAHPWASRAVVIFTAAHLLNLLPRRLDPYHGFGLFILQKGRRCPSLISSTSPHCDENSA